MIESRCGLCCSQCSYKEAVGCQGCLAMESPFWGECCIIKDCCIQRGHEHCGECEIFPCDQLNAFAYDQKQGDQGTRIERCRIWRDLR